MQPYVSNKSSGRLTNTPEGKHALIEKKTDLSTNSKRSRYATNTTLNQSTTTLHNSKSRSPLRDILGISSQRMHTEEPKERSQKRLGVYKREQEAIRMIVQGQREAESEKAFLEDKIAEVFPSSNSA